MLFFYINLHNIIIKNAINYGFNFEKFEKQTFLGVKLVQSIICIIKLVSFLLNPCWLCLLKGTSALFLPVILYVCLSVSGKLRNSRDVRGIWT